MNDSTKERRISAGLSVWDAAAFQVFAAIALLGGILALGVGGIGVFEAATHETVTVSLDLVHPIEVASGNPAILSARSETAVVEASGISGAARVLLAAGAGVSALVAATVAATVALFLWRLAQGRPFHRSLFGATLLAGAAMAIGGLIASFASGIGTMQAAFDLDPDGKVFVPGFTTDPGVVVAGAVVLALAFVFRSGTRLQRDTEGLV